ncbi:hypothetical protein K438DRAFT_1758270 [Mycena galopus ATCC 62051]|nr:hypothetical protein K438DRAFT_1758270 [Mycena galopus ATCC 62051]
MQLPSFSRLALIIVAFALSASAAPVAICDSIVCQVVNGTETPPHLCKTEKISISSLISEAMKFPSSTHLALILIVDGVEVSTPQLIAISVLLSSRLSLISEAMQFPSAHLAFNLVAFMFSARATPRSAPLIASFKWGWRICPRIAEQYGSVE